MHWHATKLRIPLRIWLVAAIAIATYAAWPQSCSEPGVANTRVATFNIEFFPRDQVQIREAFELIAGLDVSAVGLQEITDPALFAREAKERLGDQWRFVHTPERSSQARPWLHIGVLFDSDALQLQRVTTRQETQVNDRTHPTLQVELLERASGRQLTLLVVHFKAMTKGRDLRRKQYAGLRTILADVASRQGRVITMGDFNATEEGDRTDLDGLASATGMRWATRDLPCSAFWEREDDCPTSRLDHIISWQPPTSVTAKGGCEQGCERRDRCPLYHRRVSDHCPVVIEIESQR